MRKALKIIFIPIGILLSLIIIYFFAAVVGMLIPVIPDTPPIENEVEIFVHSNGLHADLVIPKKHPVHDWEDFLHTLHYETRNMSYVAFGWGEKNFYLNTPTMSDLTFPTLVKALFVPSTSAMHVDFYYRKPSPERDNVKKIIISEKMYRELVDYILDSFQLEDDEPHLFDHPGYYEYDQFYAAKGKYHALWTCNNWTNEGLKKIGIKNSLWTPMDWGVFFYLE
jgi:uncharacterized protein (TIGR02117 family)